MAEKEYIEREAIIEKLNEIGGCDAADDFSKGWDKAIDAAIKEIKKLPAADVVHVKHGEWKGYTHSVFFRLDKDDNPICRDRVLYYCSECSRRSSIKTNYCQNCGAKMDEGDKNAR